MKTFQYLTSRFSLSITLIAMGCGFALGATTGGITWQKSNVVAVVLVEPDMGGFKPVEGSSIGNTRRKSDVHPVVLLKPKTGGLPSYGRFEPREGSAIGNSLSKVDWSKNDVIPVMLVEPTSGGFIPLQSITDTD